MPYALCPTVPVHVSFRPTACLRTFYLFLGIVRPLPISSIISYKKCLSSLIFQGRSKQFCHPKTLSQSHLHKHRMASAKCSNPGWCGAWQSIRLSRPAPLCRLMG
jgi:hypothetical protein